MERKKASDFDPQLLSLFHKYIHGGINRREFLDGAAKFAVGGMTAMGLWDMLRPNYAWAQQVPKDDKRIKAEYTMYPSPNGNPRMAKCAACSRDRRPATNSPSSWWFMRTAAEPIYRRRRAAIGGQRFHGPGTGRDSGRSAVIRVSTSTAPKPTKKRLAHAETTRRPKFTEDFVAAAEFLLKHPQSTGKLGAVGFCFGGGSSQPLAVRYRNSRPACPLWQSAGSSGRAEDQSSRASSFCRQTIPTPLGTWPAYEAALKANGIKHEGYIYPKTSHGFHNDTTPRYDDAAAKLAWQRTVDHFNKNLKA